MLGLCLGLWNILYEYLFHSSENGRDLLEHGASWSEEQTPAPYPLPAQSDTGIGGARGTALRDFTLFYSKYLGALIVEPDFSLLTFPFSTIILQLSWLKHTMTKIFLHKSCSACRKSCFSSYSEGIAGLGWGSPMEILKGSIINEVYI